MKRTIPIFILMVLILASCIKDNPKQLTKDLIKGGRWDISSFRMEEYDNPTGWQEELVFDTLFFNTGYMEFLDENGDYGPTYRKGNFKFRSEQAIPFDWDAYGPPSSDETPVMYFIFSKPWNDFRQNYEHTARLNIWEDKKIELVFDLGYLGSNNHHVVYTIVITR